MKNVLKLVMLLFCGSVFAQISYAKQVGKKEVKKELVSFHENTDANGNVTYGFLMDGLAVGGQMLVTTDGKSIYQTFNKNHELDGTKIIMDRNSGSIELYTYRKNEKNGPAFKIAGGEIAWEKQFKNDKATGKDYKVNHSFDYYADKNSESFDGFTIEKYNGSYALGYFAYGRRAYPIIHIWDEGSSFYGQCIQGLRKEFGVYFYDDGSKYIGAWHNNYKEGLGFMMDKDGKVTEKGYYKKGSLDIAI
ncbi:hypothetical protein OS188_12270 [Xanthomarina sp. F1114]|uniref:hypothetical protein n=1 Tax=Xanthomarina sp. F1114 TaxID=2996019 RepID=UPI00225DFBF8|nr:hypothetical protein [Xanthomarina sp. F1114]MCX7548729.1 hypothetical protein [Xanthomarina sp. F1114]